MLRFKYTAYLALILIIRTGLGRNTQVLIPLVRVVGPGSSTSKNHCVEAASYAYNTRGLHLDKEKNRNKIVMVYNETYIFRLAYRDTHGLKGEVTGIPRIPFQAFFTKKEILCITSIHILVSMTNSLCNFS